MKRKLKAANDNSRRVKRELAAIVIRGWRYGKFHRYSDYWRLPSHKRLQLNQTLQCDIQAILETF